MEVLANRKSVDSAKDDRKILKHTMTTGEVHTLMDIQEERKCLLATIIRPLISDLPSLLPGLMVLLPSETETHGLF